MRRETFSTLRILPVLSIGRFYGGDDGTGGAGGSGNGSGNPGGGEQPVGLTEEASKQVNELINKALGPRFKAFEEKQAKATAEANTKLLESFGTTLDEKLAALKPTEEGDKGKGGKPPATDITQSPEFRAMQKQLKEQGELLEKAKQDKATETARAREEALNRKVEAELANYGISDPESARILLQGKKLVGYEEDEGESIVFRDEEGGALPLKKGLESWVKSAVGKRFLPPSGANGSGDRSAGGKKPQSSNGAAPTTDELGQALARELGLPLS
jgi:hypothetical protein